MSLIPKVLAFTALMLPICSASFHQAGSPNSKSDPLQDILRSQPDYVADVIYEGHRRIPNPIGWVCQVVKRGDAYRLDLAAPDRAAAYGDLKHQILVLDRFGHRTLLDPDTRTYLEIAPHDWERGEFMVSGLCVAEISDLVREIGPSEEIGIEEVDSHPCDVYSAPNRWNNPMTVYVAQDLKNLVVRIDDVPGGTRASRNLFILTNVVVDPPNVTDDQFDVPPGYAPMTVSDDDE